ncbi:hypothetical protein FB451DRAFT_1176878 [Mycena latifolia]|nr:hypothetical protein FB451DRAFT_1176878 [Mycena latifolia]
MGQLIRVPNVQVENEMFDVVRCRGQIQPDRDFQRPKALRLLKIEVFMMSEPFGVNGANRPMEKYGSGTIEVQAGEMQFMQLFGGALRIIAAGLVVGEHVQERCRFETGGKASKQRQKPRGVNRLFAVGVEVIRTYDNGLFQQVAKKSHLENTLRLATIVNNIKPYMLNVTSGASESCQALFVAFDALSFRTTMTVTTTDPIESLSLRAGVLAPFLCLASSAAAPAARVADPTTFLCSWTSRRATAAIYIAYHSMRVYFYPSTHYTIYL